MKFANICPSLTTFKYTLFILHYLETYFHNKLVNDKFVRVFAIYTINSIERA